MAKQGMNRPDRTHTKPRNNVPPVPEISGTEPPALKVYHTVPRGSDKPVSKVYPVIDNDLARDNIENDITAADLQDL